MALSIVDPRVGGRGASSSSGGGGVPNRNQTGMTPTVGRPGYPSQPTALQPTANKNRQGYVYGQSNPYTPPPNYTVTRVPVRGTLVPGPANPYATVQEDNALASALAAQSMADANAGIQRGLSSRSIGRANEKAGYDQQALAIDAAANLRQRGYLGDLNAIADRVSLTNFADLNIDEFAANRQYGLIREAKGDVTRANQRALGSLVDDRRRLDEQEVVFREKARTDFRKQISQASAKGNISLIATLDAKDLSLAVKDQVSEYDRLRSENYRKREEANDQYNAAMRDLNEKWYATDDAVAKVKLRKQMQALEDERRRREYQESLQRIEDENRQNFIKAALIELGRRQQVDDLDTQARFLSGAQRKANEDAVLAVQMVAEARARELARQVANPVAKPRVINTRGSSFR